MNLSQPLYSLVERLYEVEATDADEVIEYIVADEFRADMLKLPIGHPMILVERIVYADIGEALECSRSYYRADHFRLQHRLRREMRPSQRRSARQVASSASET
jgi:GntR family transcriptional regulator